MREQFEPSGEVIGRCLMSVSPSGVFSSSLSVSHRPLIISAPLEVHG
jgi:hypothetical protein